MTARVSIVVTAFNQEAFISEAVESALGQTVPATEVVVIDDGSTDRTPEILARHPAIRVVRQPNGGVSSARNRGIAECRGEFLILLDGDDRLDPRAVETGLAAFTERSDLAFVWGTHRTIDEDGRLISRKHKPGVTGSHYARLLYNNYIVSPGVAMYRISVLREAAGFDVSLRGSEDYDLHLRLTRTHPVAFHPAEVLEYRRHGGNTTRNSAHMLIITLKALAKQADAASRDANLHASYRRGVAAWMRLYGMRALREGLTPGPATRIHRLRDAYRAIHFGTTLLARSMPFHPRQLRPSSLNR